MTGIFGDGRLRWLFLALAVLYVLPFWVVRHVPTVDGPCHTYNAWILRQYANVERYPLFQQYYEINAKPYPNWISQGGMALLMLAVPPAVAEKLLASGYVLLFLAGVWYLVGAVRPEERWLAFLAFPFAYHQLFQYGFYNFAISVAFFPLILGCWWRHRDRPGDPRFVVGINLLLWLCYFSHILSFGLALVAIAVLWLATLRRESWRRHLLHVPVLLPQIALPLWFFAKQGGGSVPSTWPLSQVARFFVRLEVLVTLGTAQLWLGVGLSVLFLLLLALSVRRRGLLRVESVFLALALLFTVFYFLSPEGTAGGWLLKNRLSLYPFLLLIPGLSPRLGRRSAAAAAGALALLALVNLGYLVHGYREARRQGGRLPRRARSRGPRHPRFHAPLRARLADRRPLPRHRLRRPGEGAGRLGQLRGQDRLLPGAVPRLGGLSEDGGRGLGPRLLPGQAEPRHGGRPLPLADAAGERPGQAPAAKLRSDPGGGQRHAFRKEWRLTFRGYARYPPRRPICRWLSLDCLECGGAWRGAPPPDGTILTPCFAF